MVELPGLRRNGTNGNISQRVPGSLQTAFEQAASARGEKVAVLEAELAGIRYGDWRDPSGVYSVEATAGGWVYVPLSRTDPPGTGLLRDHSYRPSAGR